MERTNDLPTLYWENGQLHLLDQRLLPHEIRFRTCKTYTDVIDSIKDMTVRGAPAIGISAAYGLLLAAGEALHSGADSEKMRVHINSAAGQLLQARPTAVNLGWALERINKWLSVHQDAAPGEIFKGLELEVNQIFEEDIANNRQIGKNGAALIPVKASILTHCNAGALATGGYGTALGVIRAAVEQGKDIHVYVDETRPLLQGARITAFELFHDQIPATLITDNSAGHLMSRGKIDLVVVGADRIAINGDTANKIGTYSLAVLANYHKIPFYVAAPISTIDPAISSGEEIVIEERCTSETTHFNGRLVAPEGCTALNFAFDVTPACLIKAIITELGVVELPDRVKLESLFS